MQGTVSAIERRVHYEPGHPVEQFIVPILKHEIGRLLNDYAFPSPPAGQVLDVGCGRQPLREMLVTAGYSYTGMDIQQSAEDTIDVICAIDQPLPHTVKLSSFELVICTEVMEHVADWNHAFMNLASLLATDGLLLITCPHIYPLHEEPHDYWRPTIHALRYFARKSGLTIIEERQAGNTWDVIGTVLAASWPSVSERSIASRIARIVVRWGMSGIASLSRSDWLRRTVPLNGPLYLSNVMLLRREV
jgi:SAM-dependent methyltransferase